MHRSARSALATSGVVLGLLIGTVPARAGEPPNTDPVLEQGLQWALERIGAPDAWEQGTGDGITIAIVDSGVDLVHEDLADKVVADVSCIGAAGDASRCRGSAEDDSGHGTHVAGIALAATGNGRGIAGVAPDADLMAVRVLANECDDTGCHATGSPDDVAAGIRWAADHGADVINLSLGGGTVEDVEGCSFCDAVEYAWDAGAIPVVAAGNDSVLPASFADEHAVVVTATTRSDGRASYSGDAALFSARWPISAPGGEAETDPADCATGGTPKGVLSTYWVAGRSNEYACLAGTSMAAPHVSGSLAILLGLGRSPQAAVDRLLSTARDLGAQGPDDRFGFGRLDLARAVAAGPADTPSTTDPPPVTAPDDTTGAPPASLPRPTQAGPLTPDRARSPRPPWVVPLGVAAVLVAGAVVARVVRRRGSPPA